MGLIEILYLISCDFHGQTTTTTTKTYKHSCVPRDEIFFGIIACRPNRLLESLGVVEGELGGAVQEFSGTGRLRSWKTEKFFLNALCESLLEYTTAWRS